MNNNNSRKTQKKEGFDKMCQEELKKRNKLRQEMLGKEREEARDRYSDQKRRTKTLSKYTTR